jgi:hypothetical protein
MTCRGLRTITGRQQLQVGTDDPSGGAGAEFGFLLCFDTHKTAQLTQSDICTLEVAVRQIVFE